MRWSAQIRDYNAELEAIMRTGVETNEHPLQTHADISRAQVQLMEKSCVAADFTNSAGADSHGSDIIIDPLNALAMDSDLADQMHPLGASKQSGGVTAFSSVNSVLPGGARADTDGEGSVAAASHRSWNELCSYILREYAVTGQLRVQSALLDADGTTAAALGSSIEDNGAAAQKKARAPMSAARILPYSRRSHAAFSYTRP
eukprot:1906802-Pleurochrysis_carterae.AAC.3